MEVWGLGNESTLAHQREMVEVDIKLQEQAKKVDKAALIEGDFNKEFLFENTFSHKKDEH